MAKEKTNNGDLIHVSIAQIREHPDSLRKVNKETAKYLGLVDSVRKNGLFNPISIRELAEQKDGLQVYGLVDGLQRLNASRDAGLKTVPAYVKSMKEAEVWEAQIIANVHKVETRPVEYAKTLNNIINANPMLTKADLCEKLSKGRKWLDDMLKLVLLQDDIGKAGDEGKIPLGNLVAMARLASIEPDEQEMFADKAVTMQPSEFIPLMDQRVREIRAARRQGRDPKPVEFTPTPHLRRVKQLVEELANEAAGQSFVRQGIVTNLADFEFGIRYALSLDAESVAEQKKKWENRKAELDAAKEKRKAERDAKKAKEKEKEANDLVHQIVTDPHAISKEELVEA